jgi:hypothetical protein
MTETPSPGVWETSTRQEDTVTAPLTMRVFSDYV